jgi:hypothetical protein
MFEIFIYIAGSLLLFLLLVMTGALFVLLSRFEKFEKKMESAVNILNNTILNHSNRLNSNEPNEDADG